MTRKDYILIAAALRENYQQGPAVNKTIIGAVAVNLASHLKADNPRFDCEHFVRVVRGDKELNSRPGTVRS